MPRAASTEPGRARSSSTRDRILRAGVHQFQANGYHGTGVASILDEARAPKGCFYHHFPGGKEQLAIESLEWLAREVDIFLESLDTAGSSGAEMAIGMAEYAARGLARAERMRGSLIAVLAADAVPASAPIRDALKSTLNGWATRLAAGFSRAGAADPDASARAALALLEGATLMARISGRPKHVVKTMGEFLAASPRRSDGARA